MNENEERNVISHILSQKGGVSALAIIGIVIVAVADAVANSNKDFKLSKGGVSVELKDNDETSVNAQVSDKCDEKKEV
jgi:hypothetical protein